MSTLPVVPIERGVLASRRLGRLCQWRTECEAAECIGHVRVLLQVQLARCLVECFEPISQHNRSNVQHTHLPSNDHRTCRCPVVVVVVVVEGAAAVVVVCSVVGMPSPSRRQSCRRSHWWTHLEDKENGNALGLMTFEDMKSDIVRIKAKHEQARKLHTRDTMVEAIARTKAIGHCTTVRGFLLVANNLVRVIFALLGSMTLRVGG